MRKIRLWHGPFNGLETEVEDGVTVLTLFKPNGTIGYAYQPTRSLDDDGRVAWIYHC